MIPIFEILMAVLGLCGAINITAVCWIVIVGETIRLILEVINKFIEK